MGDKLSSGVPLSGSPASALGLATLSDNHGNSTRGIRLYCAGEPSHKLTFKEWRDLHVAIEWPHAMLAFRLDGVIPILGEMESPLKTKCDALRRDGRLPPNR